MFCDCVEVTIDLLYHLNVEFLFPFRKFRLEHNEEIVSVLILIRSTLSKSRHFTRCQVDPPLNMPGPVVKQKHIGVVFPPKVLQSTHNGDGVETLPIEGGVLCEVVVNLVDCERNDGTITDWLVLLLG
jgi:hypothetical protein